MTVRSGTAPFGMLDFCSRLDARAALVSLGLGDVAVLYSGLGRGHSLQGINLFGLRDERFVWGRIYTELVRDTAGIDAQTARMIRD